MINSTRVIVARLKSMRLALTETQRYWHRDHLRTGSEFDQLNGLRSREIRGNWLIAATLNRITAPQSTRSSNSLKIVTVLKARSSGGSRNSPRINALT